MRLTSQSEVAVGLAVVRAGTITITATTLTVY